MVWFHMKRYQTNESSRGWSVFDRRTGEVLGEGDSGSRPRAQALADLLNALDGEPFGEPKVAA